MIYGRRRSSLLSARIVSADLRIAAARKWQLFALVLATAWLPGCCPTLTVFVIPDSVGVGQEFEIVIRGDQVATAAVNVRDAGLIVQFPASFQVIDYEGMRYVNQSWGALQPNQVNALPPGVSLGIEPGMQVMSLLRVGGGDAAECRIWLRAPAAPDPSAIFKVVLLREVVNGSPIGPGAWEIAEPLAVTSFAQVVGMHRRTMIISSNNQQRWKRSGGIGVRGNTAQATGGIAIRSANGVSFITDINTVAEYSFLNGTLQSAFVSLNSGSPAPSQVAVGDFNGDTIPDVFSSNVSFGQPGGGYALASPQVAPLSVGAASADLNGDGFDDIAWTSGIAGVTAGSVNVEVWDPSTGSFRPSSMGLPSSPQPLGPQGRYLHLSDVDDDGDFDLIWTRIGAPGIWLNDGNASWTEVVNPGFGPRDFWTVESADFDGDGSTDLVCSGYEGGLGSGIAFFRRVVGANGNVTWIEDLTTGLPTSEPYLDMTLADFDRDGLIDILSGRGVSGSVTGGVEIWRNLGGGRFEQAPASWLAGLPETAMGNPSGLAVGDADADGFLDLAISSSEYGFRLYLQSPETWSLPCEAGNVSANAGGPFDLLRVNGSPGNLERAVRLDRMDPFTISIDQPPMNPNPANYLIFGSLGSPTRASVFGSPWGDFCFTPALFAPSPGLFTLANSFAPSSGLLLFGPTPFSYARSAGLGFPATFVLQGLIVQNGAQTNNLAITNAVTIEVE